MGNVDNNVIDRGKGNWIFALYKPEEFEIGPFEGILSVSKDFHFVQREDDEKCIVNIPSPNVAYVVDKQFYKKLVKKTESGE